MGFHIFITHLDAHTLNWERYKVSFFLYYSSIIIGSFSLQYSRSVFLYYSLLDGNAPRLTSAASAMIS